MSLTGSQPRRTSLRSKTTPHRDRHISIFDQNGRRLGTPEVRLKPEVAGSMGFVTTFFYKPGYYNYPFAFFGPVRRAQR